MRCWVASGAKVNVADELGNTPLMVAARCLQLECVAEMLRLGADPRRVENLGRTALHWVAVNADRRGDGRGVVRLLVEAGCDAAVRDAGGRTAADVARDYNGAEWGAKFDEWVNSALAPAHRERATGERTVAPDQP